MPTPRTAITAAANCSDKTIIKTQHLECTISEENKCSPYKDQLSLYRLHARKNDGTPINDRTVAFSTAGDPNGTPALFFYPAGGNRRMLVSLHDAAVSSKLKLICVNRPGTGGTDPAITQNSASHCGEAEVQVTTSCEDCARVLECLGIKSVGMLLFMCAGTPFALAFATQFRNYIGCKERSPLLMGVGSWVLPADCKDTKNLFQFGANYCPLWLSSAVAGESMGSINRCMTSFPTNILINGFKRGLSEGEATRFDAKYSSAEDFVSMMHWIQEERGKVNTDLKVLLSPARDIAIEYDKISQGTEVVLFHGENDTMIPIKGAKWMANKIPSAVVHSLSQGSHEGSLFLLHPEITAAMKKFGTQVCGSEITKKQS